jgi:hypothetical protein
VKQGDRCRTVEKAVLSFIREHGGSVHEMEFIFGSAGRFDDGAALVALRNLAKRGELVRTGEGRQSWYSIAPASPLPSPSDLPPRRPPPHLDAAATVERTEEDRAKDENMPRSTSGRILQSEEPT